jgi:autotransporter-associated beta strand protein
MRKHLHKSFVLFLAIGLLLTSNLFAQRKVEKLGRGVVAVNLGGGNVYISWRLLVSDPEDVAFNLYRSIGGAAATKLNSVPITTTTDYSDNSASTSATNEYYVKPIINGTEQEASKSFTLPGSATAKRYISIPLQPLAHYSVQHIYPADLDGDGEYDYVVKRLPADSHNNVMIEAYKSDGTFLWRVDLGPNVEQGAPTHNPIVLAYDFDGDGKAEVFTMSGEGTVFADNSKIGDVNGDGITDYRTFPAVSLGYMLLGDNCPEFVSMVNGMTGKEIARTNWIARGPKSQWDALWGDSYGHRMSMQFIAVAYLDGVHPSIVGSRGPGELMDVVAWDFKNNQFTTRWTWSSRNNASIPAGYHWADFHNIRVADLDGDGKDEISFGVNAMDDNGLPLYYSKNDVGHGDRFVIADLDPSRSGLECYAIQQTASVLAVLYDAKNGERIKTWSSATPFDVSRGDAADVDPRYKGMELWSYAHSSLLDCKGNPVPGSTAFPHPALSIWWDGDLTRENLDAADGNGYNPVINKWNYVANNTTRLLSLYNEGGGYTTKTPYAGRVALYGDILGDWREEIFCMNSDSTEIRIFSTWTPATTKLYCLMQNPEYRACIGPKGYLPSTEVDYYLGVGMTTPPTPPVLTAKSQWAGGLSSNVWDIATTNNWKHDEAASQYTDGDTVMFDISGAANAAVTLNTVVNPGFLIVNSPVDYTITGSGSISGSTRLLKSGQGALTLGTTSDYTGKTKVEQGYLYINSTLSQSFASIYKDAGIGGSGIITKAVTFEKGAMVIPGTKGTVGNITFSAGLTLPGKNSLLFDITDDATGTTKPSDKIIVNGDLTLSDTCFIVVNKLNGTVNPGTYPLISYTGTFTGSLTNIIISGLYGQKVTLSDAGKVISITVLATRPPEKVVWAGAGANWDLATSPNWLLNGVSDVFVTGDTVVFDANGSGQYNVNVTEGVSIGNMIVDASSNEYSFTGAGSIGGTGGLTKTGVETLTISNSNIFTGKVAINGGILQINKVANAGNASPLGASTDTVPGGITLSNAYLRFTGTGSSNSTDRGITLTGSDTIDISAATTAQLAFASRIAGTGTLVKKGPGILMLQPTSKNTFSGGTIIKEGIVSFGSVIANQYGFGLSSNSVTLDSGKWSMYNNTGATDYTSPWNIIVNTIGTINATSRGTLTGSLTGSGKLTLYVPYVRTWLNGDWSAFTGNVTVTTDADGGMLRLGKTNYSNIGFYINSGITASYVTTNSNSTDVTGNVSIGELSGAAGSTLYNDNWIVGSKNTDATFSGTITGNSITKVGTGSWTLTGANTYTGGTIVNGGTFIVNNTTGSGTGTGAVTVNTGAILAGTGTIAGAVTIASGGTIAPGNNGTGSLVINSNLVLAAGSTTAMEVNKSAASDTIRLTGSITYNGTLAITNTNASDFAAGESYKLFKAATYKGSFTSITPATPGTGMVWDTTAIRTNGTIKIKAAQTITFGALADKTFGDAAFGLSATASSGLTVSYATSDANVVAISGSTATITGAGTVTITASQAGDASYMPATSVSQSFNVGKGVQTISFSDLPSKKVGDAPFNLAATSSSGLSVSYTSSNTNVATVSGSTVTIVGAGTTDITASQSGNSNYNAAADVIKTLTVDRASQTITFSDLPSKKVGDAPFSLTATSSSGLPVSYTSSNTSVATVSGSTVSIVGPGTTDIIASQAGDNNYNAAQDVSKTLNVTSTAVVSFTGSGIVIAPNPVSDELTVKLGTMDPKTVIEIYTLSGVPVYSEKVVDKITTIPMAQFQTGLYIIKVTSQQGILINQIIKQ